MSIHLDAAHRNLIRNNSISGIILDPALDSDAGIVLENGSRSNVLEANDVSDTGDAGIVIHQGSHDNRVLGGVLVRNGDAGVIVGESDRIEIDGVLSQLQSDGGVVIANSSGSSVKNSDLRYNPSGVDASNTNGLIVDGNDVSNSLQAGIELGNGIGMRITNNVANLTRWLGHLARRRRVRRPGVARRRRADRGQHGEPERRERHLDRRRAAHDPRATTAHNNAGYGIEAGEEPNPGEPADPNANIDGGGNGASGNHSDGVTPGLPGLVQCLGVVCDETGIVPMVGRGPRRRRRRRSSAARSARRRRRSRGRPAARRPSSRSPATTGPPARPRRR